MNYHLLVQGNGGNVHPHANRIAENDDRAIDAARRLYCTVMDGWYEIWRRGQHLHTKGPLLNLSR